MAGHSVIQFVDFGLSGDADHVRGSHAEITSYELNSASGAAVPGGVYDLRLGTTDHRYLCLTCQHDKKLCPGHRGHLRLRVGVYQPVGISEIRHWLRAVCLACGEIMVPPEKYAHIPPPDRLGEVATMAAAVDGRRCRCGAVHPRIVKDDADHFTYWAEPPGAKKAGRAARVKAAIRGDKLYPDTVHAILGKISDATVKALGKNADNHPRKLVLHDIVVPTNQVRPGVRSEGGGASSYHDSTNLLQHLVKRNGLLPEQLPVDMGPLAPVAQGKAPEGVNGGVNPEFDRAVDNLQQLYYDMIYGSSSTSATQGNRGRGGLMNGSRPVKGFLRNLPRKEGRIRAHLLGERVFYISRSTISGNMRYRIDEVGVPLEFARTLQVREVVQEYNREFLMPFFLNGMRQYPGCTRVIKRASGVVIDLKHRRDFALEVGDVVFRDVIDGDLAFFNRQPTLERSSIGVHRVIVVQDPSVHTFQMNVLACENYNADQGSLLE
jgi:DNA-directed RNA polymerase II subunit RPB1